MNSSMKSYSFTIIQTAIHNFQRGLAYHVYLLLCKIDSHQSNEKKIMIGFRTNDVNIEQHVNLLLNAPLCISYKDCTRNHPYPIQLTHNYDVVQHLPFQHLVMYITNMHLKLLLHFYIYCLDFGPNPINRRLIISHQSFVKFYHRT